MPLYSVVFDDRMQGRGKESKGEGRGNKCTLLGYQRERLREAVCIYHYTV